MDPERKDRPIQPIGEFLDGYIPDNIQTGEEIAFILKKLKIDPPANVSLREMPTTYLPPETNEN